MTFRKSLTILAAVALVAFAVTIADAGDGGSPCPGMAQAGGAPQMQMKGTDCGHGQMNAADCAATCKQMGMAGGAMGQMQGGACCKGKMPADCCKGKMMGAGHGDACQMHGDKCKMDCMKMMHEGHGDACQMHGDKCEMDCMKMMGEGCGDDCSMDKGGCNWSCNGIWGDYDCSNPGGRSLLNCRPHWGRHMMFRGGGDDGDCEMMMSGEGGRRVIRIERMRHPRGERMERQMRMMRHKGDDSCKPGCMGMGHGEAGSMPKGEMTPPAQMQHEGCPHSGK